MALRPFLLILILLILPVGLCAQKLNQIDLTVKNVRSGTTYQEVLSNLGKPVKTARTSYKASQACSGNAETHLSLKYPGLEITLLGDGKGKHLSVYAIEITSGKWSGSGSTLGDSIESIEKRFGKSNSIEDRSGDKILYYADRQGLGGVNFYFRNGKLRRILMTEALC